MNYLKQLFQYKWFVSRTDTLIESAEIFFNYVSLFRNTKAVEQVWRLRDPKPVPLHRAHYEQTTDTTFNENALKEILSHYD